MWSVRVDAEIGTEFSEALAVHLRQDLPDRHAVAGAAYVAGRRVPDRVSVQLSMSESTARQAVDAAAREVTAALRAFGLTAARVVRIEVMPEEELDAEMRQLPVEFMGVREIAEAAGVSRQRADQLTKRDDFPAPIATLASGSVWPGVAVRRWLAAWERTPGRPRASSG